MSIDLGVGSIVASAGQQISFSSMFSVTAGAEPQYVVVSGLDRDEYTASSNGNLGTISGNGQSETFTSLGSDAYTFGIVYTYNAATGQYVNSTYGSLATTTLTASTDTARNEALSVFTTSDLTAATSYANNPYALSQISDMTYVGTVDVVTQPTVAGATPLQATPDSICSVAQSFVGHVWNDSGCWVLACNISAEAGASLPFSSSPVDVVGQSSGEWVVAYDGPAGGTGDWMSMLKAGEIVNFATSSSTGHITTVVSGSGSTAQVIDNVSYVNSNGTIANSANDGDASDIIIAGAHSASQELSGAVNGTVVIYELDTPTVTAASSVTVTAGRTSGVAGMFSVSDPAGNTITSYQVYDASTQNSFVDAGVSESAHTAATAITVSAADLATLQLSAGSALSSDTLEVRAFNGTYWGDWQAITVNSTAQIVTAQVAAQLLSQNATTPVSIQDSAANIAKNLSSLGVLATAGQLTAIAFTDGGTPTLSASSAQLTAGASALVKVAGIYTLSSTASAVAANLSSLTTAVAAGQLSSITLTDSGTPSLALNAAQLTANASVLGKISSSFSLSTSASGVTANLASLEALAVGGHLASVTLTDSNRPTFTLTVAQYNADSALLSKITSSFVVSVTAGTSGPSTIVGAAPVNYLSAGTSGAAHLLEAGASTVGVDMLYGGMGADTLDGSTSSVGHAELIAQGGLNILNGGLGYDTLVGGGHSVLNAGASSQTLLAGFSATSHDTLNAGSGSYEFLATTSGSNILNAGSGAGDFLIGGVGADHLNGSTASTGSAILIAGSGANVLQGGLGADTLVGGGDSVLTAGSGNRQVLVGGYSATAHDTLNAGSGNAVLGVLMGNNVLNAGTGNALLYGGSGNDTLLGGGGNAALVAGSGHNVLIAGSGSDTLVGGGESLLIGGSGANGTSLLLGGYSATAHDTLEAGTGSGEILSVTTGNNMLYADSTGSASNDVLWAGTGNDTLYGAAYGNTAATGPIAQTNYVVGAGNSTVLGGAGNDYVSVQNGSGSTVIDGGAGTNYVSFIGHAANDATINTNAAGVTSVSFADSTQTATLTHVTGIIFEGSSAAHALA